MPWPSLANQARREYPDLPGRGIEQCPEGKFGYPKKVVSINEGTPIAGWFIMDKPNLRWMMTGGSPIGGFLKSRYPKPLVF